MLILCKYYNFRLLQIMQKEYQSKTLFQEYLIPHQNLILKSLKVRQRERLTQGYIQNSLLATQQEILYLLYMMQNYSFLLFFHESQISFEICLAFFGRLINKSIRIDQIFEEEINFLDQLLFQHFWLLDYEYSSSQSVLPALALGQSAINLTLIACSSLNNAFIIKSNNKFINNSTQILISNYILFLQIIQKLNNSRQNRQYFKEDIFKEILYIYNYFI
ncbi:hypothetical protein TTHERM_000691225 (macronuclear) [Tetrahymena thermophila SB210]|uniref:Uncharacterized protein n=1 Tax=Tetrahymena thermophila (strain SB210) TaxID=312017 RepID=W7XE18_TETTS|nr:hypothetical protein TTHERM_000691225 [Tetrahymena thermophila SB210]EWS72181.1 hypothetical protein TTHERM_000691225 [Tetrahymena thermophila SB210]|eukprot:XP_012655274.1 hypothetical protein TTHERM_000691225 [Tetrahymena thermophila SB210]